MKTQSVNAITKKLFLGSILSAAILFSANANASTVNGSTNRVDSAVVSKAEISYKGVDKNELLSFTVKYKNESGSKFSLLVFDNSGEAPLFKAAYNDKNFSKEFKMPKSTEISKLTFLILNGKESYKEVFDVNINTREITDVVVNRN
jgi:C4-type Zn-finger protein